MRKSRKNKSPHPFFVIYYPFPRTNRFDIGNVNTYLTLSEMASRLKLSKRKFSSLVISKQIPYLDTGRSKLFIPATVEAVLLQVAPARDNIVKFTPTRKRKAVTKGSFAEAMGL